jgi:hypothetical protein
MTCWLLVLAEDMDCSELISTAFEYAAAKVAYREATRYEITATVVALLVLLR